MKPHALHSIAIINYYGWKRRDKSRVDYVVYIPYFIARLVTDTARQNGLHRFKLWEMLMTLTGALS